MRPLTVLRRRRARRRRRDRRELVARDVIPNAVHVPLDRVREGRLPELPRDADLIVVCEWGRKSELAGLYLEAHGFTRVLHLAGGVAALRRAGGVRDAKPGTESH